MMAYFAKGASIIAVSVMAAIMYTSPSKEGCELRHGDTNELKTCLLTHYATNIAPLRTETL
jgi:hypothetical protein